MGEVLNDELTDEEKLEEFEFDLSNLDFDLIQAMGPKPDFVDISKTSSLYKENSDQIKTIVHSLSEEKNLLTNRFDDLETAEVLIAAQIYAALMLQASAEEECINAKDELERVEAMTFMRWKSVKVGTKYPSDKVCELQLNIDPDVVATRKLYARSVGKKKECQAFASALQAKQQLLLSMQSRNNKLNGGSKY